MNEIRTKVVGVRYENQDGGNRQALIGELQVGDPLLLVHDPQNPHDANAVEVRVANKPGNPQIGFLGRELAVEVATHLRYGDAGAEVMHVSGGTKEKPTRGVNIRIFLRGARLDEHGQPPPIVLQHMRSERDLQEMLGIAKGILMDGVVTDDEVRNFLSWCDRRPQVVSRWPGNQLHRRLVAILEDGVVDERERTELAEILGGLVGGTLGLHGTETPSSLPFTRPVPKVEIAGRTFVFSGKFAFGPRPVCEAVTVSMGGLVAPRVTRRTDYLIVGTFVSRDWRHGAFGRKIETAVRYREKRGEPAVVAEDHWAELV